MISHRNLGQAKALLGLKIFLILFLALAAAFVFAADPGGPREGRAAHPRKAKAAGDYYDGQGKPLSVADIDRLDSISSLSLIQKRQILDSPDRPWHYESGLAVDGDWTSRPLPFSELNKDNQEKDTVFTEYDSREKTILSDSFAHQARQDHVDGFREAVNQASDKAEVPRVGLVWKRMIEDPVLKDYFNPFWVVQVYADQVVSFKGRNTLEKFWPFAWQQLLANKDYWRQLEDKQARQGRYELYVELGRILTIARHQLTSQEFAQFKDLEEDIAGKSLMGLSENDAKMKVKKRITNALAIVQKDIGGQIRSKFCAGMVQKKAKTSSAKKARK